MGEESARNRFKFASELERIFSSAEFARSPVMRRLLRFLVDETLAGKGEMLKAYSVAVDGLGRDPDFDAQSDSYPRVQVGRLRRMLDKYYNHHGLTHGERLIIPNGAYRVYLHPVYRKQEHASPPLQGGGAFALKADTSPETPNVSAFMERLLRLPNGRGRLAGIAMAALALVISMAALFAYFLPPAKDSLRPQTAILVPTPKMLLQPVEASVHSPASLASSVDQILGDALHRSWVVNVASHPNGKNGGAAGGGDYAYRLQSVLAGPAGQDLFLTLWDNRTGERIWTHHVQLSAGESAITAALRLPIANVIGSFGAIASHERQRHGDNIAPGYPCLLKDAELWMKYSTDNMKAMRQCVGQMLAADPVSPPALVAAVKMNYRLWLLDPERRPHLKTLAQDQAKQAVLLAPYSADAQMASAVMAFLDGRCLLGKAQGLRALKLNPYEPELHARLGMLLFSCGDRDHEKYLIAAREMNPGLPAVYALPVIVAMGERGETDAALQLALSLPMSNSVRSPFQTILMAIAYANHGDKAQARKYWQEGVMARSDGTKSPRAVLEQLPVSPGLKRATGEALRRSGVIDRLD